MNHQNGVKKIGKDSRHRIALLKGLATSLFRHEHVVTTTAKGKSLKSFAESLIERGKVDTLHNRRMAYRAIRDTAVLKKLFENIGKRYQNRKGGYTRLLHLGMRKGDGGETCRVELVEELLATDAAPKAVETKAADAG
jgi:large subunit ribosomal protein L17